MSRLPAWGSYLSPITAQETIGRSLARQLWLKFGEFSVPPQPTVGDLRRVPTSALEDRGSICSELVYVEDRFAAYAWDRQSTTADDGVTCIAPSDVPTGLGGRWLRASFSDHPGPFMAHILRHVQYIDSRILLRGAGDEPSLLTLCSAKLPALFICPTGKQKPTLQDQEPHAMMDERLTYQIKAISGNWRSEPAARFGSPLPDEAAIDPGTAEVLGRVEWFLRKHASGLADTMGVGVVTLGAMRPADSWGQDMLLMDVLDLTIQATTEVYNEPPELIQNDHLLVQFQQRQDGGSVVNIDQPFPVRMRTS